MGQIHCNCQRDLPETKENRPTAPVEFISELVIHRMKRSAWEAATIVKIPQSCM